MWLWLHMFMPIFVDIGELTKIKCGIPDKNPGFQPIILGNHSILMTHPLPVLSKLIQFTRRYMHKSQKRPLQYWHVVHRLFSENYC